MEQRPLRLGDILDDYCTRERRVTNHAIVAMVGEDVKQTRCTTCDAEHAYKGGRQPRRRKKDAPAALYREVLAGMPETELAAAGAAPDVAVPALIPPVPEPAIAIPDPASLEVIEPSRAAADSRDSEEEEESEPESHEGSPAVEEGPVHRRLIRATLPRPEGAVKETRPIPEFTMRQNGGRNGGFRGGQHRGNGAGTGDGHRSHGRRFAGGGTGSGAPGRGQGRGGGFRGGNAPPRAGGGGKKRSR